MIQQMYFSSELHQNSVPANDSSIVESASPCLAKRKPVQFVLLTFIIYHYLSVLENTPKILERMPPKLLFLKSYSKLVFPTVSMAVCFIGKG